MFVFPFPMDETPSTSPATLLGNRRLNADIKINPECGRHNHYFVFRQKKFRRLVNTPDCLTYPA